MKALVVSAIGGQKRIHGVNRARATPSATSPMCTDLYLQGRMNLDDLVSRTIPLRDINRYDSLKSGSLKRVLVTSFSPD